MKKHFYLLLFLSIFFASKSKAQCNTWVPLGIDDTIQASFGTASYMSISNRSVASFPVPYHYAIYSDGMVGGKASVLYPVLAGTSKWVYVGKQGFTLGQALYTNVQKGNTNVYAAYQDMTTAKKAAGAMMWNGTTWTAISSANGFSLGTATQLSMAVTVHKGVDSVFVAYRDGAHHNRLTVLQYSGTGTVWDTVGKSGFSLGAASYITLQVDTNGGGRLYVAYSDSANAYKATAFMFTKSGGWTSLGVNTGFSTNKASYLSLNVINPGNVVVAFSDSASSNKGKAMKYSGGTWAPYGSATGVFTLGPASYTSMAASSDTSYYFGYNDDSLGYANVMYCDGKVWHQWGNPNLSAGRTSFDCISYLNIGLPEPFILYRDAKVNGKATVMVGGQNATTAFNYAFPPMGISQNYAYTPSIAINRTTREPVVAFVNQDTNNHDRIRVKTYNGSAWNYVGGNLSTAKGKRPSMGVNRDTNYVAYIDAALGGYPVVKKFNGTAWVGVGSVSGQVAASKCNYVSLAFDYKNQPYVAFDDGTQGGAATVEYFNGSSWVVLGTAGFNKGAPGGRVSYVSMGISHANVFVVFSDSGIGYEATLWEYASAAWKNIIFNASASSASAAFTSIAVDSTNDAYMAMQDSGLSSNGTAVTEYNGTSTPVILGSFSTPISAGVATGQSIALDSLFNPYVSYIDATQNNKVTVLQYNGSAWNTVGTAGISEGAAITTTQISVLGTTPFVTYQDRGTIIKKFASAPSSMTISPALSVVCLSSNSVKLTASGGGAAYTWSPGSSTGAAVTVTPTTTTVYTVKSTISGCPVTATATVDVSASGDDIFTVAGTGNAAYNGDGGPAISSSMYYTTGVVFDSNYQNMYVADQQNSVIRKVNVATNIITTIAGNGIIGPGYTGDGNPATAALLNWPSGLAIYHDELYIADQVNNAIRVVNLKTNVIKTYAGGNGIPAAPTGTNGDGGAATAAQLHNPTGLAFDSKGNLYIADANDNKIRLVNTSGTISTYAGTGTAGYAGDGLTVNPLIGIELNNPTAVAINASDDIIVADKNNNRVRKIPQPLLLLATASTIAGIGTAGYSGDGGAATSAKLNTPIGVTLDGAGNIYIADEFNNRIREVLASNGVINTIAGNGTAAASSTGVNGDGGPAVSAQLNYPWAVALDNGGNIYIPDNFNNRVREIKICSVPATTIKATPNPICAGASTKITVTGGNYYSWSPATGLSSVSTATVTATPSVTTIYSVTVNGSVTDTITIHVLPSPTLNVTSSTHLCSGTADTIRYTTNASSYTWTVTGATISTTTSTYFVTNITSSPATFYGTLSNGTCTSKDTVTVSVGTPTITVVATPTSVCRGSVDTLKASGASTYVWSPTTGISASSGATVIATPTTSASTVTYTVIGTATGGCNATATVTITVKAKPTLNVTSTTGTICNGNSTTVIENTSVASYLWSTGATSQSTSVNPTSTTTYTVIGTTSLGCSDTGTVTVNVTNGVPFSIVDTNITCSGICNGSATAIVSGTDTYTYQWNSGATSTNPEIKGLCPGADSVIVTDQVSGCIGKATTTITQPAPLKDTLSSLIKPLCNGSCNGIARDTVIGGTAPFTYSWNTAPAQTTQAVNNLCAGSYTVSITDSNNCKATYSFTVTQPAVISVSATATAANCFGSSTGTATAKVIGGSGSYTYSWSTTPAQTTSVATALAAGTYTVTITDVNGCTAPLPATVTVTQAAQIKDTITGITGEKCNGGKNGAASITVNGGLPAYSYSWNDGETASNATALTGGVATCTVTDKNGCSVIDTATIPQPAPINISKDDTTICPGAAATLTASALGGTSPYTYLWSNFVSGQVNRVTPGSTTEYTVTVTDNIGCKNSVIDTVHVSLPIVQGSITQTGSSSCVGTAITLNDNITGGSGTITYTWQPGGQTGSNITVTPSAGTTNYTVTVSDGCSSTTTKDSIGVTMYNPVFSVCCDTTIIQGQSVTLVSTPSSGITFTWAPATGLSCTSCPSPIASPTVNTTYTIVGTSSGCTTIDTVTILISNGSLVFYTGITPNGDGNNDTWVIDNIELYPDNSVGIFNRWGIQVWSGNNYNNSTVVWKGNNSMGQPLPDGTYFYVAKVSGTTYKGWIQLTR